MLYHDLIWLPLLPGFQVILHDLLVKGEPGPIENHGVDLLGALLQNLDRELLGRLHEQEQAIIPGLGDIDLEFLVDLLLPPTDLLDIDHLKPGDYYRGNGNHVLGVVTP